MPPKIFFNFRPSESASGAFSDHLGMDHITTNYYLAANGQYLDRDVNLASDIQMSTTWFRAI